MTRPLRLARLARQVLRGEYFAALHPTFAEAARGGSYDSTLLTDFRVARARLNGPHLTARDLPSGYALVFAAVHLCAGTVRVTDLGGACGEWAIPLRRDARREIAYTVVENAALAAACAGEPRFDWARFSSEPPPTCDVFVSSGTLQYLEDPYELLDRAFSTSTSAVVLARNAFADRELFRTHRSRLRDNGLGRLLPPGHDLDAEVRYAHRTVSLDRVQAIARLKGWRCVIDLESSSGVLPYRDLVFGRDLLFIR